MSKYWKSDSRKRPIKNTIELELRRLERIHDALLLSVLKGNTKHSLNDLEELKASIDELKRMYKEYEAE